MNTSERLQELFALHVAKKATQQEQQEFWDYIDDPAYNNNVDELLSVAFLSQTDDYSLEQSQSESMLRQVFKSGKAPVLTTKVRPLWSRLGAAAAAAIVICVGAYFFNKNREERQDQLAMEKILPGNQAATLTLANGKKIRLSGANNGTIANEAGITITKTSDGTLQYHISDAPAAAEGKMRHYNTLSTAKGETYQVKLPDGTVVYLNAASSITYESSYANSPERRVKLQGEGYFEVARVSRPVGKGSRAQMLVPFIVETNRQQIEVLGTHFNVNSYTDEKAVKTTLLEGIVRVSLSSSASTEASGSRVTLKPGQQAVLSSTDVISVQNVEAENFIAWKNGFFHFEDASVETVLRQFARWYNIEVIYTGKMPVRQFTGDIYRNVSFAEALKIIGFAKVKFEIEGKKVIISP
ncbi:putative anti-sigma factor [Pedobacter sp. BAL39]|uniref:FecR family protein n=1 Tax=Pedobacter sp. BAL39 TaxID=391596 RepID=UPI0001559B08|nr:FecR family protein [Pedobacter sp. BAL39]EDM36263.1 putative anti-sigma factor [Pedobacter sp. BAL39]